MSFLFKRKKIFLFVFLFVFIFLPIFSFAQSGENPLTQEEQGLSGNLTQEQIQQADGFANSINTESSVSSDLTDGGLDALLGLNSFALRLISPITAVLGFIAISFSSMLMGISAYFFDFALQIGVYGISDIVNAEPSESNPIKQTWEIFRNIANIGIIFALLFIAIKTILQDNSYSAKSLLGKVVIAALLMNFSFFFGALVVDVSNEMSLTIYEKIGQKVGQSEDGGIQLGSYYFEKTGIAAISSTIQKEIDPNSNKYFEQTLKNIFIPGHSIVAGWKGMEDFTQKTLVLTIGFLMGTIVNLILACVLFLGAFMIIGRLVAILILLVIAPIAFASNILPNTQKISKDWWGSIVGQSFFLPAFLLFIYVGVQITDKITDKNTGFISKLNTGGETVGVTNFTEMITKIIAPVSFQFALVMGLFIAAVIVAKKISSQGNATVGSISASVTSATGGAVAAGGAFLGRNTLGMGATLLSKNQAVQDRLRTMNPLIGGTLGKSLEGIAKSSFDARKSRVFEGVASRTGVGGDFSKSFKPAKDGFKGQSERLAKRIESTYNAIPDKSDDDIKKTAGGKAIVEDKEKTKATYDKAQKDLKKALESGSAPAIAAAQTVLDNAKTARDSAQEKYEIEKNAAKAKFVQTKDSPVSIKNVWLASPTKDARKKVKESFRENKEDTKQEKLLQKLLDAQKP
jgi:hypothetical protein